ncbi:class I adenylate-forming enzyme family protein [Planosporangium sp. 12N6]|uniref:class I adenylate-forming enzyme family protein n=1 Tax=Planosporangium spinosum TaxID=3402278 RepID=UPI003CF05E90
MNVQAASEVVPIGQVLRDSYVRFADRVAITDDARSLTYAELHDRARGIAAGLRRLGCAPGDRVVLLSPNRCEWVEVDHACYLGGFVRVAPLTRLHPRELNRIVADADPTVIVAEGEWLDGAGRDWIPAGVRHLITIGERPGTSGSLEDLYEPGTDDEFPPADLDTPCWIMYTSGSTGAPKGVVCNHRSVGAMTRGTLAEMTARADLGTDDVAVHTAPLGHWGGSIALALYAVGGTNILEKSFDAERLAAMLDSGRITVLPLVPTQINMLVEVLAGKAAAGAPVDVSRVKLLPYAGSAIAPDRLAKAQEVFGQIMLQFYGSSEALTPVTTLRPEDHVTTVSSGGLPRLASAGKQAPFSEVAVVGPDGAPLPPGETGEITTRGAHVMPGYWRLPDATAEVLNADGWVRTGDMGYLDDHGFLFIVDRKKDMIVTGGFNVYPREVENAISTLAGVREVTVVGAPSERWGEAITAIVVPVPGVTLTKESVVDHCRQQIAGYKVPKEVLFRDELPKSGTGKILKHDIRDALWQGRTRKV